MFAALGRLSARAALGGAPPSSLRVIGPASLADLAPALRPIGAAMVLGGFDPAVDGELRRTLNAPGGPQQSRPAQNGPSTARCGRAIAVGMALMRGDLEMGATGTVTHVDGNRVYAFGHPFLNMGPTTMPMTRARVVTVLPSLDSSMKIATLGPMIGTDLAGSRRRASREPLGNNPPELDVVVTLKSERAADRRLQFKVVHDQTLTPLFAYVAILNSLAGFERQSGVLTVETSGEVSFGAAGTVSGGRCVLRRHGGQRGRCGGHGCGRHGRGKRIPARAGRTPVSDAARARGPRTRRSSASGSTPSAKRRRDATLNVLLRDYRGGTETVTMPVTLPAQTSRPCHAARHGRSETDSLEDRDLRPGRPTNWQALLAKMNGVRKNNRSTCASSRRAPGTVVAGETLPSLPASVRSVFDEDKTVATAPVAKSVVGSWEQRMNRMVRGSRELTLERHLTMKRFFSLHASCPGHVRGRRQHWPDPSGPLFWTIATSAEFLKGTSDGVFVSAEGVLRPGPALANRLTSTPAQVWSVAEGADGTLWAGTGGDGKVLRLRPGQPEEVAFDADEANIFAVAVSGNRTYAASSPDGRVYVIEGTLPRDRCSIPRKSTSGRSQSTAPAGSGSAQAIPP